MILLSLIDIIVLDQMIRRRDLTEGYLSPFLFIAVLTEAAAHGHDGFFEAFQLAIEKLDHDDFDLHNHLVECGLPLVLTRYLARAFFHKDRIHQIEPVCRLLCCVLRCYTQVATLCVQDIAEELYPLLLNLPLLEFPSSVCRLVERIGNLPVAFHGHSQPQIIRYFRESIVTVTANGMESKIYCFFCLAKGLVNDKKTRHQIVESPSLLLDPVLEACRKIFSGYSIQFLLFLVQDSKGRRKIAGNNEFYNVITTLLSSGCIERIEAALSLISQVSKDRFARTELVAKKKFKIIHALINCEKQCSERSLQETYILTIRRLLCSETATSELADSILDNGNASPLLIARCMYRFSSVGLFVSNGNGKRLLDAILKVTSKDMPLKVRSIGAKSLLYQSKNEGCSFIFLRTPSIVDVITSLVNDSARSICAVGIAITNNFASSSLNHRVLCRQADLIASLCSVATTNRSQDCAELRRDAVTTLLMIANQPTSTLAKQHHFVSSLANYGLQKYDDEDENNLQRRSLKCVLQLMEYM